MRQVVNDFKYVCHMRITGVEISKKSKCAKQTTDRKVLKHCKSYIHCVAMSEMMIQTMFGIVSMMRIT